MKLYISADIEGIAGIVDWDEASEGKPGYEEFRHRMTAHVAAACEGAVAAGAKEILVKDAHATGRNIFADRLPPCAKVIRGWSGHPLGMVQEIDKTCDAAMFIGYHSRAGSGGNPLAHTLRSSRIALLTIAGHPVSEFHLCAWAAGLFDVPTVLVSGDEALCEEVHALNPNIGTVPVLKGVGNSTIGLHPSLAAERIRAAATQALQSNLAACKVTAPNPPNVEIRYRTADQAYAASWYPGCKLIDDVTVGFETDSFFEVLRALNFLSSI